MEPSLPRPLAACTIIARNFLSHARTLAQSFLAHEPGGRFYVLVVDGMPEGVEFGGKARVIAPAELGFENWRELCFQYNPTELCTAVKPHLLSLLLDKYGESQLLYLDPDILVLAPLTALKPVLADSSLVLTPHLLTPIPPDGLLPGEQDILISGAYNLGFLGVRDSAQTRAFLAWWDARLQKDCRADICHGLFVDQKWVDLVPGYFDGTAIFRDDAYNVAFWNLHERALELRDATFYVNGRPLTFFHFSAFNPAHPETLSRHQNRIRVADYPALAELLKRYAAQQMENGHATWIQQEYGYGRFDNGIVVNAILRRLYLNLDDAGRAQFGDPFQTTGANSFLEWATRPNQPDSPLSPFMEMLYLARFDISGTFTDAWSAERAGFLKWAQNEGAREMGYEPELVRDGTDPAPLHAAAPVAPPPAQRDDIFDGAFPPAGDMTVAQLKYAWQRERNIRSLELWAQELELALLKKDKTSALDQDQLNLRSLSPQRAARWFKDKLNRKVTPDI